MDFGKKKLPRTAAGSMRRCPIHSVAPYTPVLAPMYVFMKQNEKFVSVKAPMDFFLPDEIERLTPFGDFYFTEFVDDVLPFRDAAAAVRAILNWVPRARLEKGVRFRAPELPLAPYEISDAVLRVIGPLWGKEMAIEPFFVFHFAHELCGPLPEEAMIAAREDDIRLFETALLRSAWVVFLELLLGRCEIGYLTAVRRAAFARVLKPGKAVSPGEADTESLASRLIPDADARRIEPASFEADGSPVSLKIFWRLHRVRLEFKRDRGPTPSIFGPRGFRDE